MWTPVRLGHGVRNKRRYVFFLPLGSAGRLPLLLAGWSIDQNDAIRYSRHSHPEVALQRDQGLCSSVVNVSEDSWNRACKAAHRVDEPWKCKSEIGFLSLKVVRPSVKKNSRGSGGRLRKRLVPARPRYTSNSKEYVPSLFTHN